MVFRGHDKSSGSDELRIPNSKFINKSRSSGHHSSITAAKQAANAAAAAAATSGYNSIVGGGGHSPATTCGSNNTALLSINYVPASAGAGSNKTTNIQVSK